VTFVEFPTVSVLGESVRVGIRVVNPNCCDMTVNGADAELAPYVAVTLLTPTDGGTVKVVVNVPLLLVFMEDTCLPAYIIKT